MAMGDPYITGPELAQYIGSGGGINTSKEDSGRDQQLSGAAAAATRAIRKACGRDFNKQDEVSARIFTPYGTRLVIVDDIYTTTGLVIKTGHSGVFGEPWETTDYELEGNIVDGVDDHPFTRIVLPRPTFSGVQRVQVTAKWGWSGIPEDILQATKMLGAEYYKLRTAPFGASQAAGRGASSASIPVQDVPQVWGIVCEYRRSEQAVFLG